MTDFPVMNNNAHALPLLAALRLAGIEPLLDGSGLRIATPPIRDAAESVELDTPLLRLSLAPGVVRGSYRPVVSTTRAILVEAPAGATVTAARLDGADVSVPAGATEIRLVTNARPGQEAAFEVRLTLR